MVRFQADADLNLVIVHAVIRQEPAVDFQTAVGANLAGMNDFDVLTLAADEKRLLVTHDKKTMPHHFANFIEESTSTGVLIVPQSLPVLEAAEDLLLIWVASTPNDWENRIGYLPL